MDTNVNSKVGTESPLQDNIENVEGDGNMHKSSPYVRTVVALHNLRDRAKEAVDSLNEKGLPERVSEGWNKTQQAVQTQTRKFVTHSDDIQLEHLPQKYGYVFRPKSCWELVLLGGTVCGIEFCYSAETAFVTPILLSLGLNIKFVTMIWCLSPLIGLFFTPVLGSMSDSCVSKMGRRRPFILLYSIGILLGLLLVPNGHAIGIALGDRGSPKHPVNSSVTTIPEYTRSGKFDALMTEEYVGTTPRSTNTGQEFIGYVSSFDLSTKSDDDVSGNKHTSVTSEASKTYDENVGTTLVSEAIKSESDASIINNEGSTPNGNSKSHIQPWSIVFTVIGTMLLDFCSDACQSPSRTYLLDVSLPDDHAAGLSTFTLMAGLGGSVGYLMGAIHWEDTWLGHVLGGQVNVVFMIVTVVFIFCLIATLSSFPEIPLPLLRDPKMLREYQDKITSGGQVNVNEMVVLENKPPSYGATEENNSSRAEGCKENGAGVGEVVISPHKTETVDFPKGKDPTPDVALPQSIEEHPTLKDFVKSIFNMPRSLKILCLTNLFCWMSLVCYSLYFTDFVAECVFGGDPTAPEESESYALYKEGVSFGCWGMSLYSLSCAVYSYFIEALVKKIGARTTYVGGQLVYSVGMVVMAITRHKVAVILLSPTAGVMYATLFTMPYLLIAHYHSTNTFSDEKRGVVGGVRGIGTDVAAVSSMVFLSQFVLSMSVGSVVEAVGSNVATVCAAAILSCCGAVTATQVLYLDI